MPQPFLVPQAPRGGGGCSFQVCISVVLGGELQPPAPHLPPQANPLLNKSVQHENVPCSTRLGEFVLL